MDALQHDEGAACIGGVRLDGRAVLGPMAGVTDRPFRVICREMGAAMTATEMVSANAVKHGSLKTREFIKIDESEHPVSMQLFGPDADTIAFAIDALRRLPYDILDINMGCPMPKIVNNGEGCALMKKIDTAAAIVRMAVRVSDRPVTVKMRAGFDADSINAVELALAAEDAGAAAVAVHGRTREQYYSGSADWEIIRRVKEAVKIPVIGNGDVTDPLKYAAMREQTGCDFVMIARAARGNPWIFRACRQYEETGTVPERPSVMEVREMMLRHASAELLEKPERVAIPEMRKHAAWYAAGYRGSARLRSRVNETKSYAELEKILDEWVEEAGGEGA